MKIAFDAQLLMKGEKTGIAWLAENILHRMPIYNHELTLNCFSLGYSTEDLKQVDKYTELNYAIQKCTWFHDAIYRIMCNIIPVPYYLFFFKKNDVTIFFNYIVPPGVRGKRIVFVHDMAYKAYPETVRKRTKNMLNIALRKSCKRADMIITISEFSKSEIINYLGIDKDKIVVMPCGVDFTLYHNKYTEEAIQEVKRKYGIEGEYFFYLGTLEPRKNIIRLIHAFALLKEEAIELPKLVLAGRKGWLYEGVFRLVNDMHLENDVIFTGYVATNDSPLLMKGSKLFVFPSLYEGFGMPPLEAMACGAPVMVSNTASLPEVVDEAAILVDPYSITNIKDGMLSVINDKEKRDELIKKGYERARMYSWDNSARILQEVLKNFNN